LTTSGRFEPIEKGRWRLNEGDCPKKGSSNPSSRSESLNISISRDFEIPEKKKVKQLGL
jgi:hypothetical protein